MYHIYFNQVLKKKKTKLGTFTINISRLPNGQFALKKESGISETRYQGTRFKAAEHPCLGHLFPRGSQPSHAGGDPETPA